MQRSPLRRRDDLVTRSTRLSHGNVVGYGLVKQPGILRHERLQVAEVSRIDIAHVPTRNLRTPPVNVPETHEQLENGGLSRPRWPVNADDAPLGQRQRTVA